MNKYKCTLAKRCTIFHSEVYKSHPNKPLFVHSMKIGSCWQNELQITFVRKKLPNAIARMNSVLQTQERALLASKYQTNTIMGQANWKKNLNKIGI
jgi:hypothetical protein